MGLASGGRLVYVSTTGSDSGACGLTLASACRNIAFTIMSIARPGDTIEISPGLYTEGGPTIIVGAMAGVNDLTVRSADGKRSVTIDRQYLGRYFEFMTGTGTFNVQGLRFLRGGWDTAAAGQDYAGGLMRIATDAPNDAVHFHDCHFEGNINPNAGQSGRGGVATITAGQPKFTYCSFNDNWGGTAGTIHVGSAAKPVFEHCVFENSGCFDGWGGVVVPEDDSRGVWRHCVFRNNSCNFGGAVDDGGSAQPLFENCTFEGNYGRNLGGAYYGFGQAHSRFVGCKFVGNRVAKGGNGQDFYLSSSVSATFEDCSFDTGPDPVRIADGGAGACKDNSTVTMTRCTLRGYQATFGTIALTVTARGSFDSCIFDGNDGIRGGAITTERSIIIRNCTFSNNVANEGGAVCISGDANKRIVVRIENSTFNGNVVQSVGGAIKASGATVLEIENSAFDFNTANGVGGGALFASSDTTVSIAGSRFTRGAAASGGGIWAEGKIQVTKSTFEDNVLFAGDVDSSDICSFGFGAGGAIFLSLPSDKIGLAFSDPNASAVCDLSAFFIFSGLALRGNSAGGGGGGGVYFDGDLPPCVSTVAQVCAGCEFSGNVASYGADMASAISGLALVSDLPRTWELMAPVDVVIGGVDAFGQRLAGSQAPVTVRIELVSAENQSSTRPPVALVSNSARVFRLGNVTFRNVALKTSEVTNTRDRKLLLKFSADKPGHFSSMLNSAMKLVVPLTLSRCLQGEGLVAPDGRCLVEAPGNKQEIIAGVIVAVVLSACFFFMLYWSYKHSHRVLETLHAIVTGVGGIVLRFMFELLDLVTDLQALVDLFLYDLTIQHQTLIRAAYVTIVVISFVPSVGLLRWSAHAIRSQWKRIQARKVFVLEVAYGISSVGSSFIQPAAPSGARATSGALSANGPPRKSVDKVMSLRVESFNATATHKPSTSPVKTQATRDATKSPPSTTQRRWDIPAVLQFLQKYTEMLELDLEYQYVRTSYMKRVLARLITEDVLLLAFNLYIYQTNKHDGHFARSKFRTSLEYSILTSAVSFGAQVQTVATWLQSNKIGEIVEQLGHLKRLRVAAVAEQGDEKGDDDSRHELLSDWRRNVARGGASGLSRSNLSASARAVKLVEPRQPDVTPQS
ncbi:hypothetical protein P43SY_007405 [Pythium insidiosum]|uniref:Right handed beta helix domain-containing protein n=1 Tax=Pythium insidiosum TaxID=114742 RepID=A0AAD5M8V4_PYTIN|nr:hypothetical protein P43SY_007405 [Pythium insidiosum]